MPLTTAPLKMTTLVLQNDPLEKEKREPFLRQQIMLPCDSPNECDLILIRMYHTQIIFSHSQVKCNYKVFF